MKISSYCDQIHPHSVGDDRTHPQRWEFWWKNSLYNWESVGGRTSSFAASWNISFWASFSRRKLEYTRPTAWLALMKSSSVSKLYYMKYFSPKVLIRLELWKTSCYNSGIQMKAERRQLLSNSLVWKHPISTVRFSAQLSNPRSSQCNNEDGKIIPTSTVSYKSGFFNSNEAPMLGRLKQMHPGHNTTTLIFGKKPIRPRFCSRFRGSLTLTPRCFM